MVGNRHKGPTDDEPDSGSARSSDDMAPDDRRFGDGSTGTFSSPWCTNPPQIPFPFIAPHFSIPSSRELGSTSRKLGYCVPDKAKRRKRQTRSSINAMTNEGKDIMRLLAELKDQMREQSMQLTESNSEIRKQMGNLIESQNGQSKVLEKLIESQNGQSKELEKLTASIRKHLEFHTNITGHAESDAPRSQMNQVPPPRYRLEFNSAPTGKIITGKTIKISVALVEVSSGRPVENGPLASGTVELVVVNAEFNQHNNRYYWPREDFESNITKPRRGNSATGGVDQSVKSIVSNGQFNLSRGVRCYSGSAIFENSHNRKVRLGAMLVLPTGERVLEALSDPLLVRDHVQSGKQSNLHPNSSNGQRQGLGDNDYQEENSSRPNMQQPSWPNSTHTGGIRSNIIGGQSQLPFLGTSNMLSTEPFTSQEQQSSIQQYQSPRVPMVAQATYNQNVANELAWPSNYLVRDPNFMGNDHVLGHAIGSNIIGGQSQLPFLGTSNMLSTEPFTSQEQQSSIQQYQSPRVPMVAQATYNQNDTTLGFSRPSTPPRTLSAQTMLPAQLAFQSVTP